MEKDAKIFVAGHCGLVGSAIIKNLKKNAYTNIITRTHKELDLADCEQTAKFFKDQKPDYVFLAAAKVGGIVANNVYRADFIYENLMIQTNVIHYSYLNKVKKLMFLGSTCIYPKHSQQPIKEEYLLTGELEYTNEPYAIAKIAGIKMCESYNLQYGTNFISVMPTNLYGPNDNYDLEKSHVLPALIRKTILGKALEENDWELIKDNLDKMPIQGVNGRSGENTILAILSKYGVSLKTENGKRKVTIEIWGSGKALREFLWSEDMADACIFIMNHIDFSELKKRNKEEVRNTHINIGTGQEISISQLSYEVKKITGFGGKLFFNSEKPEGTLRKVTDCSKLHSLGWKSRTSLAVGIEKMQDELINKDSLAIGSKESA